MSQALRRLDARCELGECPLWDARAQRLRWTDIDCSTLAEWHPASGSQAHRALPWRVGSFALCERPGLLLLGLAHGVALYDLAQSRVGRVTPVEPGVPRLRINDGRCDPQGRFVFGMFNEDDDGRPRGHFHRVGPDLRVERLPLPPVAVANSLAFSPDGRSMYFADSPRREILRVDYHADGRLGEPQRFARLGDDDGVPDGATTDAEGRLWVAVWGGGCVLRFDPDGRESLRLPLPERFPTCPVFGGPQLDRLFVTTARKALDAAGRAAQPDAGAVYAIDDVGRGRPEHLFRTALEA